MHLDDERIQRLLHGELSGAAHDSAREHVAGCEDCRRRLAEASREEAETFSLFRELDDPAPWTSAGALAARGRAPGGQRVRSAAAFAIALGLAGAAYALPGSPLRGWVASVAGWIGERRPPSAPAVEVAPDSADAGIAVVPGPQLLIVFTSRQAAGWVRIAWTDGAEVIVRAPPGAATFTSDVHRLVIDNHPGAAATFSIEIPRQAPRVEIEVEGARVFLKEGPRVIAPPLDPASGAYRVPLAASGP